MIPLTGFFAVHYTGASEAVRRGGRRLHQNQPKRKLMKARYTRLAVLMLALSVAGAGCGRYSISNIRSLKAFQDANALYKKAEYKQAIGEYERSIKFNPELGFAYFFLGNSYDNLYKPARKGEPENDANLGKAAENYRLAIQKLSGATDPKEIEIRKLTYEYLIAA